MLRKGLTVHGLGIYGIRHAWILLIGVIAHLWCAATTGECADAKKIALLVGNKNYTTGIGQLRNPHNDVELLRRALEKVEFTVLPPILDADRGALLGATHDYVERLKQVGEGAIGFFYYAGHGFAAGPSGPNFLLTMNVKEISPRALQIEAVKLDDMVVPRLVV